MQNRVVPIGDSSISRRAVLRKQRRGEMRAAVARACRDLSGVRNALGTELADERGEAQVLNGAVLMFDKGSPFIHECMARAKRRGHAAHAMRPTGRFHPLRALPQGAATRQSHPMERTPRSVQAAANTAE